MASLLKLQVYKYRMNVELSSYYQRHRAVLLSPFLSLCLPFILSLSDFGALVLSSVVGVLQICTVSKPFNFIPQLPFPLTHPPTVTFILTHFHKMLYLLPQIVYINKSTVKYNLFIDQQERGMQTFLLKAFPLSVSSGECFS